MEGAWPIAVPLLSNLYPFWPEYITLRPVLEQHIQPPQGIVNRFSQQPLDTERKAVWLQSQ